MEEKIDIVILWVDGNDPNWQKDFLHYAKLNNMGDKRVSCFRDWGTLKYWFRGIEKFAPWVNKIHFVTYGHYPEWLNLNCPKLNFVKHSDFIPAKYLPTFNANTIELNIHRIKGLSEKFIYFNDDLFLIREIKPDRFFKKGKVADSLTFNALSGGGIGHIILNDIEMINKHFNKKDFLKKQWRKWLNPIYGKDLLRTIFLSPWPHFTGFIDPHFPTGFYKSTFSRVWDIEPDRLDKTCCCHFRNETNVNQYLMRYWQLVEGNFTPINVFKDSIYIGMNNRSVIPEIKKAFDNKDISILVLNDDCITDFEFIRDEIMSMFKNILPDKCQFEI
ncbi:Capsular polysaccharide phosphotransferase SacB [uncultured Bacteroides sp.]|uniref:stealth family protein n=1 Tax=Bacteroides cellulolyticus TaxID=2981780 RepID=UPI000821B7C3|nr:stealth family protein [Bacteroides cellulolyticus]MCU6770366.1 stealth family protein [Bacteroides cellulolyticus]SCH07400.1 Capsular polysaccharide phosphotransferase SacB [uncultured Bacteroides sp.]